MNEYNIDGIRAVWHVDNVQTERIIRGIACSDCIFGRIERCESR